MSAEDQPGAFYPMEASAREIAQVTMLREGGYLRRNIPEEFWPEIEELLTSGVHDGIEFGEFIAALPDQRPSKLEHYFKGYTDGIEDTTTERQGE